MRSLATIREIANIRPIPGADRIVVAQVDGWECVVQKDEFQVGQRIVYVEVDSQLPERPEFEFLRERKFRVRTIKLRGQVSQGLVLPMTILPAGDYRLGDDVTELLGITKYDPQAQQEAALLETQKLNRKNRLMMAFMRFRWFRHFFGKSKQKKGNKYHISGYEFFAFNLIFPGYRCTTAEMAQWLEPLGVKTVPILEERKALPQTIAELVEYAKGRSKVLPSQKREGVVMRNMDRDISFKVINPDFLLAEKD